MDLPVSSSVPGEIDIPQVDRSDASQKPVHVGREEHVTPLSTYLKVYGALLVLTYVTVQVSLLGLGAVAIYVAMAVAVVKATLVAAYFMHLKHDVPFNTFVFVSALLFLAIFAGLTMADIGTRGMVKEEEDNFVLRNEQSAAKAAAVKPTSSVPVKPAASSLGAPQLAPGPVQPPTSATGLHR